MKVGAVVICRYSSGRLPGKILKLIQGKPVLQYILERLKCASSIDAIVVATSDQKSDQPIVDFCENFGVPCHRGSLEDVSHRFLDAAVSHELDYAIRINGDNLFVDPSVIDRMVQLIGNNKYDFLTNVPERTFPTGMSVEIVRTEFYSGILNNFNYKESKEHVTLYLYQHEPLGNYYFLENDICPEAKGLKLAIDDEKDFIFARSIISKMKHDHRKYGLQEIYHLANEARNEHLER